MGSNVYRKFLKLHRSFIPLMMISMLLSSAAPGQSWNHEKNSISGLLQGVEINRDITKSAVLSEMISLKMSSATVLEALEAVADQADLELIYNAADLKPASRRLSLNVEEMTINQALWTILEDTGFRYAVSSHGQLVIMKNPEYERMQRQFEDHLQVTVTGQVVDAQTGEALPGVNVIVVGSEEETGSIIGVTTNMEGGYSIQVPEGLNILAFTYIGYQRLEVDIDGRTEIDIQLNQDTQMLDDIVVIGYGTVERRDLTGSIGSIDRSQISDLGISRVDEALLGKVAGVEVIPTTGEPGLGPTIRVRGIGSISAGNEPLYVVDGHPIDNIQMLNPNDIQSIDILKDASSTAIYGSRGANGVVLISTNRGQIGSGHTITVDYNHSWQQAARTPEFLTAYEQAEYYAYAIRSRNLDEGHDVSGAPEGWAIRPPQTVLDVLSGINTTDNEMLNNVLRTSPRRELSLSATGSMGDDFTYNLSAGYLNDEGVVINSNFDRLTLRAGLDGQLTDRLSVRMSINTSLADRDVVGSGEWGGGANQSVIAQAASWQKYYPAYNDDGSYFIMNNVDASTVLYNPIALAEEVINKRQQMNVLSNLDINFSLSNQFSLQQKLGGMANYNKSWNFTPNMEVFFNNPANGSDAVGITTNWISETLLNYNETFGKHNVSGLAGIIVQQNMYRANNVSSNLFPNNLVPTLNAATVNNGSSDMSEWTLLSYLARINYDYSSKYYLTASLRTDGSSRFGVNNKYAVFPSFALAWRITQEDFFPEMSFLNDLKIRASYGHTGNNNIGNYQDIPTINYLSYNLSGSEVAGYTPARLANPDLTWEKQMQYNFGIDISLFDHRVNITADHFRSKNVDLLLDVPVPRVTGFSNALQNIGEIFNTGWEFTASSINVQRERFFWGTEFNISKYKNEVLKLGPEGAPILAGDNRHLTMIGYPLGMHYGLKTDGIFKTWEEVAQGPLYNPGAPDQSTLGDIRYVDIDGDGVITNNDRTILGSPYPDLYFGMTHTLSYRNFGLNISFQGSYGNLVRNQNNVIFLLTRSRSKTLATQRNFFRSEEDPGDGVTPRPNDATTGGIRLHSDRYLDDGSYLRINNITLNYTIPVEASNRIGVNTIRAYISTTNPFTFTNYTSWNPAAASSSNPLTPGVDTYQYPLQTSIRLGVNITL